MEGGCVYRAEPGGVLTPFEVTTDGQVQPSEQDEARPRNSQKDGEGIFHVLLKTKIRTNGVTRNSSVERRPADSQHRRQLAGE